MIFPVQNNVFLLIVYSLLLIYHLITETISLDDEYTNRIIQDYQRQCGTSGSAKRKLFARIVNSNQVDDSTKWPWMAYIQQRFEIPRNIEEGKMRVFGCGGTLIGPKHVLTAEHCTSNMPGSDISTNKLKVFMGNVDNTKMTRGKAGQSYNVISVHKYLSSPTKSSAKVFKYEKIVNGELTHDIAILVLDRLVEISSNVRPICLPSMVDKYESFSKSSGEGFIAGWGSTVHIKKGQETLKIPGTVPTILREGAITVMASQECGNLQVMENEICVNGGSTVNSDGDSGDPVMVAIKSKEGDTLWTQVGLHHVKIVDEHQMNGVVVCYDYSCPQGALRITYYLDWIMKTIRETLGVKLPIHLYKNRGSYLQGTIV